MLIPLRFNDGKPVPDESIADTLLELEDRFGAVSCETQATRGYWRHEGESYRVGRSMFYIYRKMGSFHVTFCISASSAFPDRHQQMLGA